MNAFALGDDGYGPHAIQWTEGEPIFTPIDAEPEFIVTPGFIDIHIHGAFGIDFMSATTEQMVSLCDQLDEVGYEGFLPTTVTAAPEDIKKALDEMPDHEMILGFHLEGPFISSAFPGAQPPNFILDPPTGPSDWDSILHDPRLRVITMAGERPGALELIERLAARDVVVSLGHTNATYAEAEAALEAGASHATHTFNAMRGLHHREAGMLGFALSDDDLRCELIYDKLHVSEAAAALLFKCKPLLGVIAISDATMAAGLPSPQNITMWGLECVLENQSIRLKDGTLAGSAITLLDAYRNLAEDFGLEAAELACCWAPRDALGIDTVRTYNVFDLDLNLVERHYVRYNG